MANDKPGPVPTGEPAAPAPARKKTLRWKILGIAVAIAAAFVFFNGKKIGEEREAALAKKEGRQPDPTKAKFIPPWEWTTRETKETGHNLAEAGKDLSEAAQEKAVALKKRIAEWKEGKTAAPTSTPPSSTPPASTTPDSTAPATPPTAAPPVAVTPPAATPAAPPPGFEKAHALVKEGADLWEKHDLAGAKTKLAEAVKLLKPMAETGPVHPMVAEDLKLANDLLEDIGMR